MMKNNQKGGSSILIAILVLSLMTAVGVGIYFWQNYEKEKAINLIKNSGDSSKDKDEVATPTIPTMVEEEKEEEKAKSVVVVFTPSGLFTETEKTELQTKFVDPFIDWNIENEINTVSIEIEKPSPAISGYRYKVGYINEGGSNGGFLFGTSTPLEWWLPECMNGCEFSAEFRVKYPELVDVYESL